jgi:protein SCO1/2
MNRKLIIIGIATLAVLILIAGIVFATRRPSFHGVVINPPAPAAEIKLTDSNGQPFSLSDQKGKVVLMYFGYTNCPNECPLTMAKLKQTTILLKDQAKDVQVMMVTTDPARDTIAQLKQYVSAYDPSFLGLTGTPQDLQKVYNSYGVSVESNGETHSTYLYVIDTKGNLRLTFIGPDMNPQDLADDVQTLLKGN